MGEDEDVGSPEVDDSLERIFDVFMAAERRHTIHVLQGRDGEMAVADLAQEIAARVAGEPELVPPFAAVQRVRNALIHVHFSRLGAENVIEFDEERYTVARGDEFETFAKVLQLVDTLSDRG